MSIDPNLLTVIGTYGFPIVAYLLMFFEFKKVIEANTKAIVDASLANTKAYYDFGVILAKVCEKIEHA